MFRKLLFSFLTISLASAHMRMLDPPSRASLWRFPEFEYLNPTPWVVDDELWCGDTRQFEFDTRCGVCGDPVNFPIPRDNEFQGRNWRDVKVRNYTAGEAIPIHLEFPAPHGGGFHVQLCNQVPETEDCFQNLVLGNGETFWPMRLGDGDFTVRTTATLPTGVSCDSCVVRVHYRGAQNWGDCDTSATCECDPNSSPQGGMGCGEQQTFRNCADISIR